MDPHAPYALVVDDDADVREAVADLLRLSGIAVITLASRNEATRWLEHHLPPRVIVLDLDMNGMAVADFREFLDAKPTLSAIPVFVFSGAVHDRREVRPGETFSKPEDLEKLIAKVAALF